MTPAEVKAYFEETERRNVRKKNESDVRVMSSNVLFSYAEKSVNYDFVWQKRAMVLSGCYLHFRPDFLGLQEADPCMTVAIEQQISSVYAKADPVIPDLKNFYSCYTWNYTPIFYDRAKWRLLFCKWIPIDEACWSLTWGYYQSLNDPSRRVIHVNFHPTPWVGERLAKNMREINAELRRLRLSYPDTPIFVSGDYNCQRQWEQFGFLIDGVNMESACLLAGEGDDCLQYTHSKLGEMPTMKDGNTIDHICVTRESVKVNLYRVALNDWLIKASDHSPIFIDAGIGSFGE